MTSSFRLIKIDVLRISKFTYLHPNLIFDVNKFVICLLGIIFITLITSTVQSTSAEDHIPIEGLFTDESEMEVELITTKDTKYKIYLQLVFRNVDGQLINVTESTAHGAYIPHMISDYVFDELMGSKDIVTINNIKYEKAQWKFTPTLEQRWMGLYPVYSEINIEITSEPGANTVKMFGINKEYSIWKMQYCGHFLPLTEHGTMLCIPVFQVLVPNMTMEPSDVVNQEWTILREID